MLTSSKIFNHFEFFFHHKLGEGLNKVCAKFKDMSIKIKEMTKGGPNRPPANYICYKKPNLCRVNISNNSQFSEIISGDKPSPCYRPGPGNTFGDIT